MRKTNVFLALVGLLFFGVAQAQMLKDDTIPQAKPLPKPDIKIEPIKTQNVNTPRKASEKDIKAIAEEEVPPVAMTVEQKAEIDLNAKKDVQVFLKSRTVRERRDLIDAMTSAERILKRQEALTEGKTEAQALKISNDVEKPKIDPFKDSEMKEYLYKKANLSNER